MSASQKHSGENIEAQPFCRLPLRRPEAMLPPPKTTVIVPALRFFWLLWAILIPYRLSVMQRIAATSGALMPLRNLSTPKHGSLPSYQLHLCVFRLLQAGLSHSDIISAQLDAHKISAVLLRYQDNRARAHERVKHKPRDKARAASAIANSYFCPVCQQIIAPPPACFICL